MLRLLEMVLVFFSILVPYNGTSLYSALQPHKTMFRFLSKPGCFNLSFISPSLLGRIWPSGEHLGNTHPFNINSSMPSSTYPFLISSSVELTTPFFLSLMELELTFIWHPWCFLHILAYQRWLWPRNWKLFTTSSLINN